MRPWRYGYTPMQFYTLAHGLQQAAFREECDEFLRSMYQKAMAGQRFPQDALKRAGWKL